MRCKNLILVITSKTQIKSTKNSVDLQKTSFVYFFHILLENIPFHSTSIPRVSDSFTSIQSRGTHFFFFFKGGKKIAIYCYYHTKENLYIQSTTMLKEEHKYKCLVHDCLLIIQIHNFPI